MSDRPDTSQASPAARAAASAVSDHLDTRTAATEVAHELNEQMGGEADLVLVFGSFHHRAAFAPAGEIIRQALPGATLMGATAESVLADDEEMEGRSGLSAVAFRMPGARVQPFRMQPGGETISASDFEAMRQRIGFADDLRAVLLLADPFSTPMAKLLPIIAKCGEGVPVPIGGGLASGASQPGHNLLLLDDFQTQHGLVGVSVLGDVDVDLVLSQGCRPIGEPMVVTRAQGNAIQELAGRKALEVVQETAESLPERERQLLTKGLLVGVVVDEYKERFGRGDFLIRNVMGVDPNAGAVAVAVPIAVGRTVQLHVRDAATATEDLQLLLDAQELKPRPFGAALFTCNGRGTRLFDDPNHDVSIIRGRYEDLPLAGFFAAGEIGPVGEGAFVHGHAASLVLFRER